MKAGRLRADRVKMEVGFQNSFVVESRGKAGGLMLLWRDVINLSICSYSDYHIDAVIEGDDSFRITLFYGHPVTHRRAESWELIRTLNRMMDRPWLIFGDFNEVLFGWEVKGRRIRGEWQMKKFRDVMQDCNLSDIGFRKAQFTYSNKQKGVWEMKARLDRVIANDEWRQRYPKAELTDCLLVCADGLKKWNEQRFGKVKDKIKELQEKLSSIQEKMRTNDVIEHEVKLTRDLDEWFLREELLWKQRSRVDWLREGDRNTRFIHQRASHRRRVNRIEKLKSNEETWITEEEGMCGLIVKYYEKIFRSTRSDTRIRWDGWMRFIPERLNDEMRNNLMRPYSEAEIREAVFQMCPTKAPGLDGFFALFYQKNWSLIKGKISTQILRMLNTRMLEDGINKTLITLIPKIKDPKTVGEYRHISLCNVGAKIVTKMLANRLKPILHAIILDNQGAFVPGKIILDNIVAAQEMIHYIRMRGIQKVSYFALKLDISKAYDRVEWDFLEVMM
ncbi:hypothetical protein QQ045_002352 [Rhodiola kirilowii]